MAEILLFRTALPASADAVWAAVKAPATFGFVSRGWMRYRAAETHPGPWRIGDECRGWMFTFGVLPTSRHRLRIETVDDAARVLQTDEHGGALRIWRHRITVTPTHADGCEYEDRIELDAGHMTGVVIAFTNRFFHARHRRWRQLAPVLAAIDPDPR